MSETKDMPLEDFLPVLNDVHSVMDPQQILVVTTGGEPLVRKDSCEGFLGDYEMAVRNYPFFCQSGINIASILADGVIFGCLSKRSDFHQGNIYKDKFSEVWANRFKNMRNREWMHTGICAECDAWKYCLGNGMHLRDEKGKLLLCHYHTDIKNQ